jgi:hypothetical protein
VPGASLEANLDRQSGRQTASAGHRRHRRRSCSKQS